MKKKFPDSNIQKKKLQLVNKGEKNENDFTNWSWQIW